MAGADEKICRQIMKISRLSGSGDKRSMNRMCSRNIRLVFWQGVPQFHDTDLKSCEECVFHKLARKKRGDILIDGAHIEAYLALMAHEITKQQRQNPHLSKDDPRVILNKHILENSIRQTNILVTGKFERDPVPCGEAEPEAAATCRPKFVRPEFPSAMRRVYDLRKPKAIVIAKRDYGNLS